ncbi:hypothetical protein [Pelagibius sp.]|uniref:hypothetical protein n=1 Tax=Pelagibius sp. TaxID=1931238 RepID=UPI002608C797|nr:hypothetical protein [Pelagibius sp.]
MTAIPGRRVFVTGAVAAALLAALGACGKKGRPKPPEGEESAYTYPQPYPAPGTVGPPPEGQDPQDYRGPTSIFTDPRTTVKSY